MDFRRIFLYDDKQYQKFIPIYEYMDELDEDDLCKFSYVGSFIEHVSPIHKIRMKLLTENYLSTYLINYKYREEYLTPKTKDFYRKYILHGYNGNKSENIIVEEIPTTIDIKELKDIQPTLEKITNLNFFKREIQSTNIGIIYNYIYSIQDKLDNAILDLAYNEICISYDVDVEDNTMAYLKKLVQVDGIKHINICFNPIYPDMLSIIQYCEDKSIQEKLITKLIWLPGYYVWKDRKFVLDGPNELVDIIKDTHMKYYNKYKFTIVE